MTENFMQNPTQNTPRLQSLLHKLSQIGAGSGLAKREIWESGRIFGSDENCWTLGVKSLAIQGGAPKITKLVYNSNNYGLWYL